MYRIVAFGGEDLLKGNPWHHEDISRRAAEATGFMPGPASDIAWHADNIDTYLYNPLWWAKGGLSRFKAALATADELEKLHGDDLFITPHVNRAYRRYVAGAILGLKWAAGQNDVGAARNIVGISLHAIQDFYSHSNWIDVASRRNVTWFQSPNRKHYHLYTGAYEKDERFGVKHHGKFAIACSVLSDDSLVGLEFAIQIACAGISPLSNSEFCLQFRECKKSKSVAGGTLSGVKIPADTIFLNPPGIAMDNTWISEIGIKQRGLSISGIDGFTIAKTLAVEASRQWLRTLSKVMYDMGHSDFWRRVRTAALATRREAEFEQFNKFPYQFMSAGPYPATTDKGYYLRVRLQTSHSSKSGTDADITLIAGGKSFVLDYMPNANLLLAYNDFERGDDTVYTVGPFSSLPTSITLKNNAANTRQVLAALAHDFADAVKSLTASLKNFLLGLIGGHADLIGTGREVWEPGTLAKIGSTPRAFTKTINGGDEGHYQVSGSIRKVREWSGSDNPLDHWADYEVKLDRLKCIDESDWDRGSNSDEPFLLSVLVPLPGEVQSHRAGPYSDVDDGESRTIGKTFQTVRLPKLHGTLSLAFSLMESDSEGSARRNELLKDFAEKDERETSRERKSFLQTLGTAIAKDWKLDTIDVYAFTRENVMKSGEVLNRRHNRWLEGGKSVTFSLSASNLKPLPKTVDQISNFPIPAAGPSYMLVSVRGAGHEDGSIAVIEVDGVSVFQSGLLGVPSRPTRGISVAVVNDANGRFEAFRIFDLYASGTANREFQTFVGGITKGKVVVMAVKDEGSRLLDAKSRELVSGLGSKRIKELAFRDSWCMTVKVGSRGTMAEDFSRRTSGPATVYGHRIAYRDRGLPLLDLNFTVIWDLLKRTNQTPVPRFPIYFDALLKIKPKIDF